MIEREIDNLVARLKEEGCLTKVTYAFCEGKVVSVRIDIVGYCD